MNTSQATKHKEPKRKLPNTSIQQKLSKLQNLQDPYPYMQNKLRNGKMQQQGSNFVNNLNLKDNLVVNGNFDVNGGKKLRSNSIRINRNKLPPDFFPQSQNLRKKASLQKKSVQLQRNGNKFQYRKAESQKNSFTPDKTSFFGFFQEGLQIKRNAGLSMNVQIGAPVKNLNTKRQFQSRNEPKRQKIYVLQKQHRNYTPMTDHKRQILDMYPSNYDESAFQILTTSKKIKSLMISPRNKQQFVSKYKQDKLLMELEEDPQILGNNLSIKLREKQGERQRQRQRIKEYKQIQNNSNLGYNEGVVPHITFFNGKSTAFPPIRKNNSVS